MKTSINYGFDRVRFVKPVVVDNDIRAIVILNNVAKNEKNPKRYRLKYDVTIETQPIH